MKERDKVDLGSVKIHKKVIAELTYSAIQELDGVELIDKDLTSGLWDLMGMRRYPGITVIVNKNNQVVIEVKVHIRYGLNIPDIARQTQTVVREAIEKTVDIDLKDVNVNIQGIERGK